MKHYILLLMILLFSNIPEAQSNDYSKLWKEVEQFEINGRPKSALEIVETIAKKAKKDKNDAQFVKSMLFKGKFALILEEDAQLKVINDFKTEIANSEFPTTNILESLLANLYWQYYQNNRYKFYNRTKTENKVDSVDFRTWDLQTLFTEIHLHFDNSLKSGLMLQQEDLSNYNALLHVVKDSKTYRPTLFDFLSHTALDFYKTDENSIPNPAYKFEINNPDLLHNAESFSKVTSTSKDTTSLQLKALNIYQDLIKFHLKDSDPTALVDIDIQRLIYINQKAVFSDKEDVLFNTLQESKNKYANHEVSGLYAYEIANVLFIQSQKYIPNTNVTPRWKATEALELCNAVIEKFSNSKAAIKCKNLKQNILNESLQIKTENYIPNQKYSKVLVTYKNIPNLKFKVFKITEKQLNQLNNVYSKEEQLKVINKLTEYSSWSETLKDEKDYQQHSTEIKIPKLENGRYLLYAEYENNRKTFAYSTIQVTDFALVDKSIQSQIIYQIADRNNGKPIENASIKVSYQYDYRSATHSFTKTTDQNGEIHFEKRNRRMTRVHTKVTKNGEVAYFGEFYVNKEYKRNQEKENIKFNSFLFTDRSIYRPGQTIYFKGIVISTEENKSKVVEGESVTVALYDVNSQKVSELEFKTNAFGSFNGEFVLPNNGLTGEYRLVINMNRLTKKNTYISVEEYKRPKFEAKFNPVTDTYKIDDSVTVKGNAMAFAGSSISDAKVVYRVVRNVDFPRWWYWYRPYFHTSPQEISHGEVQTDASGNFEITFKALADKSVDKENSPIFRYAVTADITDINGETRSASTTINVGYHALTANIFVDGRIDKSKKDNSVSIEAKNLNGEIVPATGSVKIYKLKAPETVIRPRVWPAPDYKLYNKEEFSTYFPHESYNNEDKSSNWEKGKLVFKNNFDTETSKTIDLKNIKKWESGQYIIEFESKDKFGQEVKDLKKTILFSDKDKTLPDQQLFSITTNKSSYKVGDNVKLSIGSSSKDVTVFITVEKNQQIIQKQKLHINNTIKTLEIPVNKNDVGGFTIHYNYAVYNRFSNGSITVNVPYPKTDLDIETSTFRDKLQPGVEETWSFKIKGPKGDKVSAELLASMYDMSLDQFKQLDWNFNPIHFPTYQSQFRISSYKSFGSKNFKIYNSYTLNFINENQSYVRFNWFGLDLGNARWIRNQYLRSLNAQKSSVTSSNISDIKEGFIKGVILDEDGLALPGATIIVEGTTTGTTSDFDGEFLIEAKKGDVLKISYVGFSNVKHSVDKDNYLTIMLAANAELDEVVVTAMGIKRNKSELTYQSESIQVEEMEVQSTMSDEALRGEVAGLQIADGDPNSQILLRGLPSESNNNNALIVIDGKVATQSEFEELNPEDIASINVLKGDEAIALYGSEAVNGVLIVITKSTNPFSQVKVRTNLQETAFFYPDLRTDKEGNISFSFTTPEALTQWKLQLVAHTKNLESATKTQQTVTQKELMVIPNAPRFLREDDQITISSKIANISYKNIYGEAILQLFDALDNSSIDTKLGNAINQKSFTVDAKGNTNVSWDLTIPEGIQAVQYKVLAKTEEFSDGEQNVLPVLSNRMLVTETMPMWIRSNQTKTFSLDKLKNTTSSTLRHHNLTLEITSNPAWYAVQALPYLMEYPYECNEQTFSRYYANALASHIANSNPRIQEVFNHWKNSDALLSNLEKNQELKSLLIQETPWLRDAQSETEQKKRIALLFDLNKMNSELQISKNKLKKNQLQNGSWPWFDGGRPNRFITQHIITGFGHLKHLKVAENEDERRMIEKAIKYLDTEFIKEYKELRKYNKDVDLSKNHLSNTQLHFMYMRSFYPEIKTSKEVEEILIYYQSQIQKYWLSRSLYSKGMMALISFRNNDTNTANKILTSLKENSITSEELGMYWKANTNSWYWYQAPIETQALLIETFAEIENDKETVDNLKIWLLKNKQTNRWKTTKATTEAVYALLLQGSDWLSVTNMVDVIIGGKQIEPSKLENVKVEAGTGYYKTSWKTDEINPEMADVTISKKGKGIAWGGLYWQYFEDLDKITSAETPLKLKKKLFLKTNTDLGEELSEINKDTILKLGDLVRVRIELRTDRNMEFIHMKDMRAAGFEPVNVMSSYKYQDGLGYYESTKDAATNFFMDYLPKGVYIFEYDLRVNNSGNMSNGITTIQSMYAPEFSSHSEGIRIKIGD